MAAPTVNVAIPAKWNELPFQARTWHNRLQDTVSDVALTNALRYGSAEREAFPQPGALRYEDSIPGFGPYSNVYCYGRCMFKWMLNRSGGTLEQFTFAARPANTGAAAATAGSVSTIEDTAAFTADEVVHALVNITDDAGGSNAAPEGQARYVVGNTANILYVQPDFTAAVVVSDTYELHYPFGLEDAADGDETAQCAGVIVSPDGILDNYWGWVGVLGFMDVATINAIATAGDAVVAAAAGVGASGSDPADLHVGYAPFALQAAAAQAMIYIQTLYPVYNAAS